MSQLPIGIQLASLRLPFKKSLVLAAKLGAEAVEIDARGELRPQEFGSTAIRQLRKMLDDLQLRISTVSFYTRRGYDVQDDLDRRIEATKKAMDFAYSLGSSTLVNHVGLIPESPEGQEWDSLVQSLHDLGAYGQRCGTHLLARTGHAGGNELARLVSALPAGYLGIDLDPGGLIVNGQAVSEAVDLLAGNILHVHARDGVRDLALGRGLEVPLGRGSVDFPNLLAALESEGYRGFLTIERAASPTAVEEIGDAVQFLKRL
jgi:sugar phosphate isomerase/epimerase